MMGLDGFAALRRVEVEKWCRLRWSGLDKTARRVTRSEEVAMVAMGRRIETDKFGDRTWRKRCIGQVVNAPANFVDERNHFYMHGKSRQGASLHSQLIHFFHFSPLRTVMYTSIITLEQ
jgi:hypothetical protein